jgi:predicted transcriptional regulator
MITGVRPALANVAPRRDTLRAPEDVSMTKLLEQAFARARELPDEDQDALAALLLSVAGSDASAIPLDNATRAAIREGLEQTERGEFVPDSVVAEADKRHGT